MSNNKEVESTSENENDWGLLFKYLKIMNSEFRSEFKTMSKEFNDRCDRFIENIHNGFETMSKGCDRIIEKMENNFDKMEAKIDTMNSEICNRCDKFIEKMDNFKMNNDSTVEKGSSNDEDCNANKFKMNRQKDINDRSINKCGSNKNNISFKLKRYKRISLGVKCVKRERKRYKEKNSNNFKTNDDREDRINVEVRNKNINNVEIYNYGDKSRVSVKCVKRKRKRHKEKNINNFMVNNGKENGRIKVEINGCNDYEVDFKTNIYKGINRVEMKPRYRKDGVNNNVKM